VLFRGVLRSAVAMKHASRQGPPQRHRPFERRDGVPSVEAAADRVADDAARPGVENDRDVDEAGGDGDVGQVRHPELVGAMDLEVACDEREDRPVVVAVGGAGETPPSPRVEVVLAHQPAHLLGVDEVATVAELGADPAVAVALEDVGDRADLRHDLGIGRFALGCGVEGGAWQSHQRTSPLDGEAPGPLVADVGPFLGNRAFFGAPFRNSISSAWRPTSRSSAAIRVSYSPSSSADAMSWSSEPDSAFSTQIRIRLRDRSWRRPSA
jgi:hypothetical protein